jgi:hypothetical protein
MREESNIDIPAYNLVGVFSCAACPVQAEGTIEKFPFYFRARHRTWSFSVALDERRDAVDVQSSDQGFYREASYGDDESSASYMPLSEARKIIERCTEEFLRRRE